LLIRGLLLRSRGLRLVRDRFIGRRLQECGKNKSSHCERHRENGSTGSPCAIDLFHWALPLNWGYWSSSQRVEHVTCQQFKFFERLEFNGHNERSCARRQAFFTHFAQEFHSCALRRRRCKWSSPFDLIARSGRFNANLSARADAHTELCVSHYGDSDRSLISYIHKPQIALRVWPGG